MPHSLPPLRIILVRHGQTDHNKAGIIQGQTDIPLNDEGRRQARDCGNKIRGILNGRSESPAVDRDISGSDRSRNGPTDTNRSNDTNTETPNDTNTSNDTNALNDTPGDAPNTDWDPRNPFNGPISAVYTSDLKRCVETTDIILEAAGIDIKASRTPLLRERFMGELENKPAAEGRQRCREENRHWDSFGESNVHMVERLSKQWDTIVSRGLEEQQGTVLVLTHGGCITRFTNYLVNEMQPEPFALSSLISVETLRSPQNTSFTVFDIDRNTFQGTLQVFADISHLDGVEKRVFNADEHVPGRW
ncbi:hypothetical protein CJU90_3726 [Yarrowia sp. C11]|nr:hypothetical protein CKK34_5336 [Yarrowia sp. E02]KAG5367432.1 hypothetical protein CJU90_3726 [Yarrowia sp. C11]